MSKQVISVALTSGVDLLGILHEETEIGYVIENPQMFMLSTNQFIPHAATMKSEYDGMRAFEIPYHAVVNIGDPIDFFAQAYRDTYPELFADESELVQAAKAKADLVQEFSPVHGDVQSKGGIILKS